MAPPYSRAGVPPGLVDSVRGGGCRRNPTASNLAAGPSSGRASPSPREVTGLRRLHRRDEAVNRWLSVPGLTGLHGKGTRSRKGDPFKAARPAVPDRSAGTYKATDGPGSRPGRRSIQGQDKSLSRTALQPRTWPQRPGSNSVSPGEDTLDQGPCFGRRSRDARVKAFQQKQRGYQAQPRRMTPGAIADRRPGQPLFHGPSAKWEPDPTAANNRCSARSDITPTLIWEESNICGGGWRSTRGQSKRTRDGGSIHCPDGAAGRRRASLIGAGSTSSTTGRTHEQQHLVRGVIRNPNRQGHSDCCRGNVKCESACRSALPIRR